MRRYVNGALDVSGTAVTTVTQTGTRNFWIGASHADQGFVGVVDEALVYGMLSREEPKTFRL